MLDDHEPHVRREDEALGGDGAMAGMRHGLVERGNGRQQLLQQPDGAVVFKRNQPPFGDREQVRHADARDVVGGDNDLRRRFGEFSNALQARKRGMLKRRELPGPLPQCGFEPGNSAQRFMDKDQIEELIPCARGLATLAQTVLKSGSGNTHSECNGVRLPYPKSAHAALRAHSRRCRGIHTSAPSRTSDEL